MHHANAFALKEWAVVVKALSAGQQLILLRKGGIEDDDGRFRIEHREFFLYPTFEHQQRKFVRPEFLADFDRAIREQPSTDDLIISMHARVTDSLVARDFETLRSLSPFHVWHDEFLKIRWSYKPDRPLQVLVLRVFKVPPVQIPFQAQYRGCKSWVELDRELSIVSPQAALDDGVFEAQRQEIRKLLR